MKRSSVSEAQIIPRKYGVMRMLVGGTSLPCSILDFRTLEIEPTRRTSTHFHNASVSVFFVASGELRMTIDGAQSHLQAGDVVVIEPGEVHCIENVGETLALVYEAMCPPYSGKDIVYIEK